MRFIECVQGSDEWLSARAGRITASEFSTAVSRLTRKTSDRQAGDFSAASEAYAVKVAIERISGKPYGKPPKAWEIERGHELETLARTAYELRTGNLVEEAGLCLADDGLYGYSTDGLVDAQHYGDQITGCQGLIEIKAPADSMKVWQMWRTGDVSEYIHQMQGGMWISGAQWCDFLMIAPDLESVGRDLYVKRIHRDEAFIKVLAMELLEFQQRVKHIELVLREPVPELAEA